MEKASAEKDSISKTCVNLSTIAKVTKQIWAERLTENLVTDITKAQGLLRSKSSYINNTNGFLPAKERVVDLSNCHI